MSRKKMTGREFEEYCDEKKKKKGYRRVRVTRATGDQGVDILAKRRGKTYAIQCKLYQKPVGNSAVQEAYAGKQYYDCDRGMVMTNSTFTRGAKALAARTEIELWENIPLKRFPAKGILLVLVLLALLVAAMIYTQQTAV